MPTADIVDDRIVVDTTWNEKDLIKAIPGSRWDATEKHWSVPLTWAACIQLRGMFEDSLQVGTKLSEWSWREFRDRVSPAMALRDKFEDPDGALHIDPKLYPFQQMGVAFLTTAGSALLGDEMGTGKTIQILSAMRTLGDCLPAVIVAPNSVKANWVKEAAKWFPEATTYMYSAKLAPRLRNELLGKAAQDPTAIVIVNYESLSKLSRLSGFGSIRLARCRQCDKQYGIPNLKPTSCDVHPRILNEIPFKTVVVDEAHRIKDPKAKQTRAVWAVGTGASVTRRWALTGTPLANDPSDLWSIMHFVAPDEHPTKSKFVDRYCLQAWNAFGGLDIVGVNPLTRNEFFKVIDPRFRRMPKELVLSQLPPKIRTTRFVEMTPKQKKAYDELDKRLITRLENGELLVARSNLSAQIRLLQLASSYCTIETGDDPNDITQWTVELREPSPKLDELDAILEEMGDKPIVVAAEQRRLIELAAARLEKQKISYGLITGAVDEYERAHNLEQFQSGNLRVLLFTLKAGGTGLTMTAADTIVFLQRSWSMIDNKQGEDRVHRIGSERHESVNIIDIVTQDTVEETQVNRLNEKMARLQEITRDKAMLMAAGKDITHLAQLEDRIMDSFLGEPDTQ